MCWIRHNDNNSNNRYNYHYSYFLLLVIVSLLLTLVAVPVVYSYFDDISMFVARKKKRGVVVDDSPVREPSGAVAEVGK